MLGRSLLHDMLLEDGSKFELGESIKNMSQSIGKGVESGDVYSITRRVLLTANNTYYIAITTGLKPVLLAPIIVGSDMAAVYVRFNEDATTSGGSSTDVYNRDRTSLKVSSVTARLAPGVSAQGNTIEHNVFNEESVMRGQTNGELAHLSITKLKPSTTYLYRFDNQSTTNDTNLYINITLEEVE